MVSFRMRTGSQAPLYSTDAPSSDNGSTLVDGQPIVARSQLDVTPDEKAVVDDLGLVWLTLG